MLNPVSEICSAPKNFWDSKANNGWRLFFRIKKVFSWSLGDETNKAIFSLNYGDYELRKVLKK